jgi:hypothetical protein
VKHDRRRSRQIQLLKDASDKPFAYGENLDSNGIGRMLNPEPMSTTSHKSNTRTQSEAAMKNRIHTSRTDRDLTGDGLSNHHNEPAAMKAKARADQAKTIASAASTKRP